MFSDVSQHWAAPCITALAERQLMRGYPDGTFRPDSVVTRAEFAALLPNAFPELASRQAAVAFRDVPSQYWAKPAIDWVTQRAVFTGFPNGTFRPRQSITRAQGIVVLVAALQASEGVDADLATSGVASQQFSDAGTIPTYARGAIAAAIERQLLTTQSTPRLLHPNQVLKRGEVAALLCRALDISVENAPVWRFLEAENRQAIFQELFQQEAGFNAEKLAFLDAGIGQSTYRKDVANYAERLQRHQSLPATLVKATTPDFPASFPARGDRPPIEANGLNFLSQSILSGCICIGQAVQGQFRARWLGKDAFVNRQMWSATKFIPLLNLVDRLGAVAPLVDIDSCRIQEAGSRGGFPFHDLAAGIMTYDDRIASSNSLAAMFKNFETPARLEKWTQQMTGNQRLSFQGRYGERPFIQHPQLWDSRAKRVLLKSPLISTGETHSGQNLVSTYDLTRLLAMAAWHWRLPRKAILPNVQGASLESVLRAMGKDSARYLDVAFEALGLKAQVRSPVILSKSGFGRSDQRDRTELTYCAFTQFSLPQPGATDPTASHQQYSLCLTLIAAQDVGDANREARYVDALMAAEVTELLRRLVTNQL